MSPAVLFLGQRLLALRAAPCIVLALFVEAYLIRLRIEARGAPTGPERAFPDGRGRFASAGPEDPAPGRSSPATHGA
jgi:hypothetical protein